MVRISTHELEETISMMVKSNDQLGKPSWWPADVGYQFPLKRHPGIHPNNWREILCNLITKCYQFNKSGRLRSKTVTSKRKHIEHGYLRDSSSGKFVSNGRVTKLQMKKNNNNIVSSLGNNNSRIRRDSTGSSAGSTVSSIYGGTTTPLEKPATTTISTSSGLVRQNSGGDSDTSHSEFSAAVVLVKNLGLSQKMPNRIVSPIVQVYDICKVNPSIMNNNVKFRINENCDKNVEKNDFMNYFGLDTRSDSVSSNLPNDVSQKIVKQVTHKSSLVNCSHVPFSSNIGLKLIQGWHNYNTEVIEKRLERLERYLCNSDLPSLLSPIKEEFRVLNNRNSNPRAVLNHFYIFPTKKRHRKGKLTPKARFLLSNYCKPCFVNLSASGDDKIKKYFDRKKHRTFIHLANTEKVDKQKENKTPFTLLESRVVLTTIDDKFKENSSQTSSLVKKSGHRANFALQTLAPRNENLVESTNPAQQSPTKLVNFINPSVVLQPIHDLFEFTKRDKILTSSHKIGSTSYKVVKTRVNVYNPRRFSTRLINA